MRTVAILASLLIAVPAAFAAAPSDFYVIPVATHVTGAAGTAWRTDVVVQNIQPTPVTINMAVVESGEGLLDNIFPLSLNGSATATVPPGGSAILSDVLRNHRGRAETSGALLVGGDQPFVITSRTYASGATGGTVGETVSPVGDAVDGGTLYLPALVSNASARSNLGFVAAAGVQPLVVEVSLRGQDGAALGARTFTVAPGSTTQIQFSTRSIAPAPFDEGSGQMRIVSGDGTLIGYASVVDNTTADASFISGGMTMSEGGASLREVLARAGER